MVPHELVPGQEADLCTIVRFDGTETQYIRGLRTRVSTGSHHTAIVGNVAPTELGTEPCDLSLFSTAEPFFVSQIRSGELELPEGHGLRLEPGSYLALWTHFDNIGPCPIEASGLAELDLVDAASIEHPIGNFNVENWNLNIPRRDRESPAISCNPDEWHMEELTCVIPEDIPSMEVIAMTPHFHAAGRRFEVRLFDGENVAPTPLLVNEDWQHAPLATFFRDGEAIRLEAGQGLNIRCYYYYGCSEHLDNTPATDCPPLLQGGPDAASEMCSLKAWFRGPVVRDIDSGEPRCF